MIAAAVCVHVLPEPLAERADRAARRLAVDPDRVVAERARGRSSHSTAKASVMRRPLAAAAVAGRPGRGAGALRPDLQHAVLVHPGDRAAAVADRGDRDGGDEHLELADELAGAELRRAVHDQRHVGAGAADVEAEAVPAARPARATWLAPITPEAVPENTIWMQSVLACSAVMTPPFDLVTAVPAARRPRAAPPAGR